MVVKPHNGDHECPEEDHADIISYKTVGVKNGPLIECTLLKSSADKTLFDKLDLNSKNGHSSSIIRLIREAIHRDRPVPVACQDVMRKAESQFVFKKCF